MTRNSPHTPSIRFLSMSYFAVDLYTSQCPHSLLFLPLSRLFFHTCDLQTFTMHLLVFSSFSFLFNFRYLHLPLSLHPFLARFLLRRVIFLPVFPADITLSRFSLSPSFLHVFILFLILLVFVSWSKRPLLVSYITFTSIDLPILCSLAVLPLSLVQQRYPTREEYRSKASRIVPSLTKRDTHRPSTLWTLIKYQRTVPTRTNEIKQKYIVYTYAYIYI